MHPSSQLGWSVRLLAGYYSKYMRERNNQERESSLPLWEVNILEDMFSFSSENLGRGMLNMIQHY